MKKKLPAMPTNRQLKVRKLIHSTLVKCWDKAKKLDYILYSKPLTITEVNVSADLKLVKCYFVPFNTKLDQNQILSALEKSNYQIRKYVTSIIKLKYSPELRFFYDIWFEKTQITYQMLNYNKDSL